LYTSGLYTNNDTSNIYVSLWYNGIPYSYSFITLITSSDILCSFRVRNGYVVFIYNNITLINQIITTDNYTNVYDSSNIISVVSFTNSPNDLTNITTPLVKTINFQNINYIGNGTYIDTNLLVYNSATFNSNVDIVGDIYLAGIATLSNLTTSGLSTFHTISTANPIVYTTTNPKFISKLYGGGFLGDEVGMRQDANGVVRLYSNGNNNSSQVNLGYSQNTGVNVDVLTIQKLKNCVGIMKSAPAYPLDGIGDINLTSNL
jgi:hypothetical protein